MLSCKEVTTLHATDGVLTASFLTRVGYRLHLMMCRHCSRYVRELARIRAAVRSLYDGAAGPTDAFVARVLESIEEPPPTRGTP
jgi:hypothetical protein